MCSVLHNISLNKLCLFYHQNKKILEDFSSRDGNGHSSPESPRESEPGLQFENTLGSVRGNDFFSEHVEEPLRSYASEARKDSLQEEDVEEIPLNEQIKEKVADVLGDNGVPLDEIVSERQDSSVDGMYMHVVFKEALSWEF